MIVVCGIIKKKPGLIVCERKKKPYEGYWEFPGGKLEKGETKRQCLVRELKEELNITISIERFLFSTKHNYDGLDIHLFCYICTYLCGVICLTEHQSFKILRYHHLSQVKFLEGNKKVIKRLKLLRFIN